MKIEIMGTGCPKCKATMANVENAVVEAGVEAEIVKVEDIAEMAARGVMMTPALAVDGVVRIAGKVPTVDEIKELLGSGR